MDFVFLISRTNTDSVLNKNEKNGKEKNYSKIPYFSVIIPGSQLKD